MRSPAVYRTIDLESKTHNILNPTVTKVVAPLVLFVLCFVLRLLHLTAQDICIDEPFSIYHAQMSLSDIIRFLKPTNNPPLFEILLHFWIKVFGISAFSVRFLPMLFGSLAVIYMYKTGIRFFSFKVGLCAALLYCFSSHSIYYAHDCRTYTLFLLLTVLSFYYFLKLLREDLVKKNIIIWTSINILLIYSHYFGFIVLFFELLAVLFSQKKVLKPFLLGSAVIFFFYLPQFLNLMNRFTTSASGGTWLKEPVGLESLYNMFWVFSNMPLVAVACLLVISVTLIRFLVKKRKINPHSRTPDLLIYLSFFVPFFLMFLISFKIPVYNARYLFFLLPFYYLTIAVMAFNLFEGNKMKWISIACIVVLFASTVNLNPSKKRESKAVTDFIKKIKKPGDLVIICTHEFLTNFAYYYDQSAFKTTGELEYEALETKLHSENIYPVRRINEISDALLNSQQRIIYLDAGADFSNPGNNVLSTLQERFKLNSTKKFEEIFTVYTFGK
jgi:mannosyltransferase